jgi:hypothetical protein
MRGTHIPPHIDVGQLEVAREVKPVGIIDDQEPIPAAGDTLDASKIPVSPSSAACSNSIAQISSCTSENPQGSTSYAPATKSSTTSGRAPPDSTLTPTPPQGLGLAESRP